MKYLLVIFSLCLFLSGCSHLTDIPPTNLNQIVLKCSNKCLTIYNKPQNTLSKQQKRLLASLPKNETILLSPCINNSNNQLINKVWLYLKQHNRQVTITRATMPYKHTLVACINIIKGPITIHLPNCHPNQSKNYYTISNYSIGCATQVNLIKMITNQSDILAVKDTL